MTTDLADLSAFVAVVRTGGFRDGAHASGVSASSLSLAVRRLEKKLGVRLLNRTTRSIAPTEAGARLFERLVPALDEVETALDVVNAFRDRPAGTLKLNVPTTVARLVADRYAVPKGISGHPAGGDRRRWLRGRAGGGVRCRYSLRRTARAGHDRGADRPARAALRDSRIAAYLDVRGRPEHPSDLLAHACLRGRFASGTAPTWEFERDGAVLRVDPAGPLMVRLGSAADLAVDAAIAGLGIIHLFEEWLRPHLDSGALEPVLEPWWQSFSGPFLYYPGRHLPAPLRAFVDFIKA